MRHNAQLLGRQIRGSVLAGPHCLTAFGPTKSPAPPVAAEARTDYTAVKNNPLMRIFLTQRK
jgi:hypothetical protein